MRFWLLCLIGLPLLGASFLDTIRELESGGGRRLIGDEGRSLGPYQFSRPAWEHTSKLRQAQKLPITAWRRGSMSEGVSRSYARTYTDWLRGRLSSDSAKATDAQVWAAYNVGLSRMRAAKGDLNKLPATTRRKCREFFGATNSF